jgi:hypothetical protein
MYKTDTVEIELWINWLFISEKWEDIKLSYVKLQLCRLRHQFSIPACVQAPQSFIRTGGTQKLILRGTWYTVRFIDDFVEFVSQVIFPLNKAIKTWRTICVWLIFMALNIKVFVSMSLEMRVKTVIIVLLSLHRNYLINYPRNIIKRIEGILIGCIKLSLWHFGTSGLVIGPFKIERHWYHLREFWSDSENWYFGTLALW